MASFLNDFKDVTENTDLLLQWGPSDATEYPLQLQARILNKTSEYEVNTVEMIIATGLTEDSYLWRDLPLPLPFLSTATYQLQVWPQQNQEGETTPGSGPVIASSRSFTISPHDDNSGNNSSNNGGGSSNANPSASDSFPPKPSTTTTTSHSGGRHDSSAAIAAGLVVPIVVGISVAVFIFMQRRQTRILEERRKAREGLVID